MAALRAISSPPSAIKLDTSRSIMNLRPELILEISEPEKYKTYRVIHYILLNAKDEKGLHVVKIKQKTSTTYKSTFVW